MIDEVAARVIEMMSKNATEEQRHEIYEKLHLIKN